jgi:hypothetical protein
MGIGVGEVWNWNVIKNDKQWKYLSIFLGGDRMGDGSTGYSHFYSHSIKKFVKLQKIFFYISTVDGCDVCCKNHDQCYYKARHKYMQSTGKNIHRYYVNNATNFYNL